MRHAILGVVCVAVLAGPAGAADIRDACMTASERRGNPRLCACIQMAADRTLTRSDQKLAASFFRDPDRAEEMRMSKRRAHEAFWERYEAFGAFAASICS